MKLYEPAMRHLLDTYIRAEESEKLSAFDDMTLVDLIIERGEEAVETLPESIAGDLEAMAETIENNVRRLIIDEMAVNPKYYEKMSELLDALIKQRRQQAIEYREYLEKIVELTRQASPKQQGKNYPTGIDSPAVKALYDNLGENAILAIRLDERIRSAKRADWRDNAFKIKEVRNAICTLLDSDVRERDRFDVEAILELVKAQREY
ncbi:hypothetical protein ACUN9V_15930 [Salinicola sp. V024]|uniref:hypothetical protein n=1 Tax=Salinicola sp. V024 TaxID=3459609 RepID=UPI004043AB99